MLNSKVINFLLDSGTGIYKNRSQFRREAWIVDSTKGIAYCIGWMTEECALYENGDVYREWESNVWDNLMGGNCDQIIKRASEQGYLELCNLVKKQQSIII